MIKFINSQLKEDTMNNIRGTLSINMKKFRAKQNLSQEDLAFRCGLHRTYISDVERGNRNISIDNIAKIANALQVSPADLLKED
jgi:transcriptional regulator with XRE-family HTH domain